MRNAYGQTAVPPYAVRPRDGAPVATPIEGNELGRVKPDHYGMTAVIRRLSQRADPWKGSASHARSLDGPTASLVEARRESGR